jgi:hypothetical protein
MTTETRLHYDIDNDISVEMTTSGNLCYVSIYNDRNNKSVAFQVTRDKVMGLADFIYKQLGTN